MNGVRRRELVLAIYPFTRGFAFGLFESPLSPIDWGIKDIRGKQKNALALEAAKELIERLQPDIVVVQDFDGGRDRADRIRRLQRQIVSHAENQSIEIRSYSRDAIRACFMRVGAKTRYEIAQAIASQVHAFRYRLPPVRQIWNSEDARMGLFDAASLVMTYYCASGQAPELDEAA